MTFPLPNDDQGRLGWGAAAVIEQRIGDFTAAALGPGLGRSDDLVRLVSHLYQSVNIPLVVDADGLNALAASPEALFAAAGPRVLTPHPGEFRRLAAAVQLSDVPIDQQAIQLSLQSEAVIVLKSHHTLTIDQDRQARNNTGNPGMATGGSGDVLTGVITALICQGLEPFDAARLAVHVHGLAGDLAAAQLGQVSMIATDLIRYLPAAFLQLESAR
jgi:NAD(P)H-hydrate epimerase